MLYSPLTNEVLYSADQTSPGSKTFVIDHPLDTNKYLVHACLEGPEAGVYYRGEGVIASGEKKVVITLPSYVKSLARDLTVHLTPVGEDGEDIEDETPVNLRSTRVADNQFTVYANKPGSFHWVVFGKRSHVHSEIDKDSVVVRGDGPYKWIQ
jgi:hypothetical protein